MQKHKWKCPSGALSVRWCPTTHGWCHVFSLPLPLKHLESATGPKGSPCFIGGDFQLLPLVTLFWGAKGHPQKTGVWVNISNGDWASFFFFLLTSNIHWNPKYSYYLLLSWSACLTPPPSPPAGKCTLQIRLCTADNTEPQNKTLFLVMKMKTKQSSSFYLSYNNTKGIVDPLHLSPHWMKQLNERLCLQHRCESQTVATWRRLCIWKLFLLSPAASCCAFVLSLSMLDSCFQVDIVFLIDSCYFGFSISPAPAVNAKVYLFLFPQFHSLEWCV